MLKNKQIIFPNEISIIIPVYNNIYGIKKLLTSFYEVTDPSYYPKQITIVDNNSNPPLSIPKKYLDRDIKVLLTRCHQKGPGAARNHGVRASLQNGSKWLLFIDSDCVFTKTSIAGYLNTDKKSIVYQGNIRALGNDWLSKYYEDSRFLLPPPVIQGSKERTPLFVGSANVLIDIEAFNKVGGYDESFVEAGEDIDLGFRLSAIGDLSYAMNSIVLHDFLNGQDYVMGQHLVDMIHRFKKYGKGDRKITEKYGVDVNYLERFFQENKKERIDCLSYINLIMLVRQSLRWSD